MYRCSKTKNIYEFVMWDMFSGSRKAERCLVLRQTNTDVLQFGAAYEV